MGWDPKEKRIGRRKQIPSIPIAWCRHPKVGGGSRCRDAKNVDGRIVQVSVTGAGIIAKTHPKLAVQSVVVIHCLGLSSPVIVRRIDPDIYPGESYYGVEIMEHASPLADVLRRRFLDPSPGVPGDATSPR